MNQLPRGLSGLFRPKYSPRRFTGFIHAWENRVFTRSLSWPEIQAQRVAEEGHQPTRCDCGGVRYTEPPVTVNGLAVLSVVRCTGCKPGVTPVATAPEVC